MYQLLVTFLGFLFVTPLLAELTGLFVQTNPRMKFSHVLKK